MNGKVKNGVILLAAISSFLFLYIISEPSICDVKIAYFGQKTMDEIVYRYKLFNGIEHQSVYLEKNQLIEIVTDSEIDLGELHLIVKDTDRNIILSQRLGENTEAYTVKAQSSGFHRIIVKGSWTSGEYAASWTVK